MQTELSVTIVRVGDHLEIRQDGLMVAKREAIQNILNNGEIEDFYDNWVYPLDPDAPEKMGKIILGLMDGERHRFCFSWLRFGVCNHWCVCQLLLKLPVADFVCWRMTSSQNRLAQSYNHRSSQAPAW